MHPYSLFLPQNRQRACILPSDAGDTCNITSEKERLLCGSWLCLLSVLPHIPLWGVMEIPLGRRGDDIPTSWILTQLPVCGRSSCDSHSREQHSYLKHWGYKKIKEHVVMGSMTWALFDSVYILEKQDWFEREFRINQHNPPPVACHMSGSLLSYVDSLCKSDWVIFVNP